MRGILIIGLIALLTGLAIFETYEEVKFMSDSRQSVELIEDNFKSEVFNLGGQNYRLYKWNSDTGESYLVGVIITPSDLNKLNNNQPIYKYRDTLDRELSRKVGLSIVSLIWAWGIVAIAIAMAVGTALVT